VGTRRKKEGLLRKEKRNGILSICTAKKRKKALGRGGERSRVVLCIWRGGKRTADGSRKRKELRQKKKGKGIPWREWKEKAHLSTKKEKRECAVSEVKMNTGREKDSISWRSFKGKFPRAVGRVKQEKRHSRILEFENNASGGRDGQGSSNRAYQRKADGEEKGGGEAIHEKTRYSATAMI